MKTITYLKHQNVLISAVRNKTARGVSAAKNQKSVIGRDKTVRVKTARGRRLSSTRWLQRQLNDPYVAAAKEYGYRSRAAFKIIEIDDKFKIFKKGQTVVDLGAAPGGWSQICADRIDSLMVKEKLLLWIFRKWIHFLVWIYS